MRILKQALNVLIDSSTRWCEQEAKNAANSAILQARKEAAKRLRRPFIPFYEVQHQLPAPARPLSAEFCHK